MDKGEMRQRVEALGLLFAPQTEIRPQIIDQYNEYAVRYVWRILIRQREHEFRNTVVLNHGDPLPVDWLAYANRARYTLSSIVRPFSNIAIEAIGTRKRTLYSHATPTRPDYYTADQKAYFLPDTTMIDPTTGIPYTTNIQAVTMFYYQRPPKLFGELIADTTDIGLPDFACLWAVQVSFTFCLIHMMSAKKRQQYGEKLKQDNLVNIRDFLLLAKAVQDKPLHEQPPRASYVNYRNANQQGGQQ